MFQFVAWATTLYLLQSYILTGSPHCWRYTLQIAQYAQAGDIVLSVLGLIPNNPVTVFKQVLSRYVVIYFVMPLLWNDPTLEWCVIMAAVCWCVAESVRYPFYQFKSLQPYLGHLRYNLFIVLYPVGVTGELICFYKQYQLSLLLPQSQKPWTLSMPNKLNVAVDWELIVMTLVPIVYLVSFPPLYMYMLAQRRKFYSRPQAE